MKDGYLSPHFRAAEFACNHCGELHPDGVPQELLDILEGVRAHFGGPVNVNSGYRCEHWNKQVGGAKHSQHLKGKAADIWLPHVSPREVYEYLDKAHDGGLGLYESFTHIDVRGYKARWTG